MTQWSTSVVSISNYPWKLKGFIFPRYVQKLRVSNFDILVILQRKKSYFRKFLADPSICFLVNILMICYIIEDLKVLKMLLNWLVPMFIYGVGF